MNELTECDPLYPFALDEILCRHTGKGGPAICHLWRQPRSFIIGMRDSRLEDAEKGRQWIASQQYQVAIRNSGGAAVPLDLGVVNISLILPKDQGDTHFHRDFELMYTLIQHALLNTGQRVDKGEIRGAYCPGDYDLSIGGRKFCGIAQRRQAHAYIIQAFVIAEGSGQERAELVRGFYDRAAGESPAAHYPLITDDSTASLEELTPIGSDAARTFAEAVKHVIRNGQTAQSVSDVANDLYLPKVTEIREMAEAMRHRYEVNVT
ncbi:lipoate--protein ligase family protein [Paenibacillus sp. FA6]|uniref:lipoate--protein ligase family protein n=1 Tax=Paenibacillus sp. FA6 TaxID=3413029 RepID=UPI003F655266